MSGNTKDGLDSLPLGGGNSRDFFKFEGKGWGNMKFCKITDSNHGDITEIYRLSQIIEVK